jgi:hypothetical protein
LPVAFTGPPTSLTSSHIPLHSIHTATAAGRDTHTATGDIDPSPAPSPSIDTPTQPQRPWHTPVGETTLLSAISPNTSPSPVRSDTPPQQHESYSISTSVDDLTLARHIRSASPKAVTPEEEHSHDTAHGLTRATDHRRREVTPHSVDLVNAEEGYGQGTARGSAHVEDHNSRHRATHYSIDIVNK